MTGIEIILLLIGVTFMIGSFFLNEKLSASDLEKIAGFSEKEMKTMLAGKLADANVRIDDTLDEKLAQSCEKAERAMEKEADEQVMHIHEYAQSVTAEMEKTHEEIMFLYSMLNDKHTEMTSMAGDLQRLAASIRSLQNKMARQEEKASDGQAKGTADARMGETQVKKELLDAAAAAPSAEDGTQPQAGEDGGDTVTNDQILKLYREGVNEVDIARQLGRGLGEVRLVIGLYEGEKEQ